MDIETYVVTDATSLLLLASLVVLHNGDVTHTTTGTTESGIGHAITCSGPPAMHDHLAADFAVVP